MTRPVWLAGVCGGLLGGAAAFVAGRLFPPNPPTDQAQLPAGQSPASQSPARDAEQAELRQRLSAALAALPERQRVAIALFDLEGYPHAEIAEVLGIPEGTVRSDVFHARRKLRESLGVYAPAGDEEE